MSCRIHTRLSVDKEAASNLQLMFCFRHLSHKKQQQLIINN